MSQLRLGAGSVLMANLSKLWRSGRKIRKTKNKPMKSIFLRQLFLGASLMLAAAGVCQASLIAGWNFNGENSPVSSSADTFNASLDSSSSITRGAGAASSAGANSFRTAGFQNDGISTANNDYFQVTLSAASGFTLSLSTIDARFSGSDAFARTPGVTAQFAYSLDGSSFTLIGSSFNFNDGAGNVPSAGLVMPQIDLSGISALQNIADSTTVTIRYYASGATTTGTWGFFSNTAGNDGLDFGGTLNAVPGAVPEPGEWGLISALGLLGICSVSTWRRHCAVRRAALARV